MINVGVIGVGVMGADHVRTLRSIAGAVVGGVYDVDAERAASVGMPVADDPHVLIKESDAVLVASADATHEEFVLACLAAGTPVLCEKPLAPDAAGCLRVVDAEVGSGRRLVSVGFMRRYDPGYVALKQALTTREIGTPLLMHCVHRNVSAPVGFTTGMVMTSSAAHEIDITRWLFDDEIVAVTSHLPPRVTDIQDPQFVVLETSSGVLVDVEVFVNARYGYDVRCELVGSHGTVTASGAVTPDWRERFAEAYRRELSDWVDGLSAGEIRGASAWDGYVATAVAEAGVVALGGGRVPVELATRPALYRRLHS